MFVSINRLQRCVQIWRLLCDQISILETMTPLDFMEFRSYLSPASGFQSLQFRLIENKLGLTEKSRVLYNQSSYKKAFPSTREQTELTNSLEEETLLTLIEVRTRTLRMIPWMLSDRVAMARTNSGSRGVALQFSRMLQTIGGSISAISAKQRGGTCRSMGDRRRQRLSLSLSLYSQG